MKKNLILIGFMGAGKTTVGKAYAELHHRILLDTDTMIEDMAGIAISDIFALQGEETFRAAESAVLKKLLLETDHAVISVGGGLPLKKENRSMLKELGTVIYLEVSPQAVLDRLKGDTTRPLLSGEHVEEKVNAMIENRDPVYREAAHYVVGVSGRRVEDIIREMEERMREQP